MPFPAPRVRLRRLMAVVAIVAIGLWGWQMRRFRKEYRFRASGHARVATMLAKIGRPPSGEFDTEENRRMARTYRRRAAYHEELRRKYEHAADRPWLIVPPDPHDPTTRE